MCGDPVNGYLAISRADDIAMECVANPNYDGNGDPPLGPRNRPAFPSCLGAKTVLYDQSEAKHPRAVNCIQTIAGIGFLLAVFSAAIAQEPGNAQRGGATPAREEPTSPYEAIVEPQVVDDLKLDEAQRARIRELLDQRRDALSQADEENRTAIVEDFDRLLQESLTRAQQTRFETMLRDAELNERRLRFNFRFQPWVDVLSWFAEQSDLSLVLDAPPPGTFNYTDSREYSPAQAIDLLNGILLTKGYTLIRRERMLQLIDLTDGIPEELVPRVEMDDLDDRGQFEIVRVVFPLEDRLASDVETEVKPLIGPHGKVVVLPKSKQIVITETAGKMQRLKMLIDSIPPPEKPPSPPGAKEPEKPSLAAFALGTVQAEAALEVLRQLMPDIQFVHDAKADSVLAYAVPSQQAAIKAAIERMQAQNPPEQTPEMHVYPLGKSRTEGLVEIMQQAIPQAMLRLDAENKELIAWATPSEHEKIRETVSRLGSGALEGSPQVQVHRIAKADAAGIVSLVQAMLPDAQVAVDAKTGSLVALATPAEQESIAATIQQLEAAAETDAALRPRVEIYPFERADGSTLSTVLAQIAPEAQVTLDASNRRLVVFAPPDVHELVDKTITRFEEQSRTSGVRQLKVYQVDDRAQQRLQSIVSALSAELNDVRSIPDAASGELAVFATPDQHALIQSVLDQFQKELPADRRQQLVAYPIQLADPTSVQSVLTNLLPNLQFVLDPKSRQIVVRARPDEHAIIRAAVEQMDVEAPAGQRLKLSSHPLDEADFATVSNVLQTLLPQVSVVNDAKADALVAWASEADHETIRVAIERLQPQIPEAKRPEFKVYSTGKAYPSDIVQMLQTLLPTIRVVADQQRKGVAVWATREEHETIQQMLDSLALNGSDERRMVVYPHDQESSANTVSLLQSIVPESRVLSDALTGSILAWATDEEQAKIAATLEQMEQQAPSRRSLVIYPMKTAASSAATSLLASAVPRAQIQVDPATGNVLAWATADEQEQIKSLLDEVAKNGGAERRLVIYPHEQEGSANAVSLVQSALPAARILSDSTTGNILAWATAEEHEQIKSLLDEVAKNSGGERRLVVYPHEQEGSVNAVSLVQSAIPTARVLSDSTTGNILAWATDEQHEEIKSMLDKLAAESSSQRKLVVYPATSTDSSTVAAMLQSAIPTARATVDSRTGSLLVWATEAEHERIAATFADLDESADGHEAELRTYTIHLAEPANVLNALQGLFAGQPDVRLSLEPRTRKVIAWATPERHKLIEETVQDIDRKGTTGEVLVTEVHRLDSADPDNVRQVLSNLFRDKDYVRLVSDPTSRRLVAIATAKEQAIVRETIAQMQGAERELEVFTLDVVDPFAAELAIENLFPGKGANDPDTPKIESDFDTQQLYVRATQEQLAEIRELLVKMGETSLAASSVGSNRRIRTIRMSPDAIQAALKEIQRVWPQLGGNPIRIVQPSAVAPALRESSKESNEPKRTEEPNGADDEDAERAKEVRQRAPDKADSPMSARPAQGPHEATRRLLGSLLERPGASGDSVLLAQAPLDSDDTLPPEEAEEEPEQENAAPAQPDDNRAPIIVSPSGDGITISSDDLEALDRFEALLRSLSQQSSGRRQFKILNLKNANAITVADTLQNVMLSGAIGTRAGSVTIVPDTRLNALIVQGSSTDLATIEDLLEVLDTSELPESANSNRARLIPVVHTKAERIAGVLEDVYRRQLTTGGGRRQIEIPRGASREMAAMLQQLNQAASGPEMTLSVDDDANAVVVMASPPLVAEVERLVETLDTAASNFSESVRVVQLKKTNAGALKKTLEMLIRESRDRSRRRRSD